MHHVSAQYTVSLPRGRFCLIVQFSSPTIGCSHMNHIPFQLFYQPMEMTNDPLLANYMERRMSVFTQKMSTFDFAVASEASVVTGQVLFGFHIILKNMHRIKEWSFLWQKLKNARGTEMVKWVTSNCTMLYEGKKLGRNSQL